ncbi:MAG: glycosyltransferase family 2 protein [Verrucomicrobiota bacterium]
MSLTSVHALSAPTPVALIIYNRPELTTQVVDALLLCPPPSLFLIADGPNNASPEDHAKCQAARNAVLNAPWPKGTQIHTLLADTNLGCRERVSSGISWVFENVEEAIILEDDIIPSPAFFPFCSTLLDHYRDDQRVGGVTGYSIYSPGQSLPESYYFSHYCLIWGWATWRRVWQLYDPDPANWWPQARERRLLNSIFSQDHKVNHWSNTFDLLEKGKIDTWDFQFQAALWLNNKLFIHPRSGMTRNIGFGDDATHTKSKDHPFAKPALLDVSLPLTHPHSVAHNQSIEQWHDEKESPLAPKSQT